MRGDASVQRAAGHGARRRDRARRIASYRGAVAEPHRIAERPESQRLLNDAADRLASANPDALMASLDHGLRFDARDIAPQIAQPVLVLVGERDPVLHPGQAVSLASMLPDGRLTVVRGVGHLPHLERPGEVVAEVVAHLRAGEA